MHLLKNNNYFREDAIALSLKLRRLAFGCLLLLLPQDFFRIKEETDLKPWCTSAVKSCKISIIPISVNFKGI